MTSAEPPPYSGNSLQQMARTSILSTDTPDITAINLNLLLSRLERSVLSPEADPKLRHSSYERTRVGANVEYARTLLLRLEHSSSTIKIQSRRQAAQNNLLAQRALIKQLNERLYSLEQLDDDDDDDVADNDAIEDEDLLGEANDDDARPSDPSPTDPQHDPKPSNPSAEKPYPVDPSQSPPNLRSRHPPPTTPHPAATSTAHTTAIATTFPPTTTTTTTTTQTRTTETLLTHNTHEQESLTTSLLTLAQALKTSSQSFASALEEEKTVLNRAGEGLDKSGAGMEAAEKRIGTLRRMSEGRGLWGRLLMYVWIAALMVLALVVVFVLPKLRF